MTNTGTLHLLKWPLGAASVVRLGAGTIKDLDVSAQVQDRAGTDIETWLANLDEASRNSFVVNLSRLLVALDQEEAPPAGVAVWPGSSSEERRVEVLTLLNLPPALEEELAQRNPLIPEALVSPLVWVDPDAAPVHDDSYMDRTRGTRWERYRSHLEQRMGWHHEDTVHLGRQLDTLAGALPDPADEARSPRRILVVGHTQSGKTANFLGLSARMADAGTQLIVILSGRTKLLRRQTQARVDRDLVGADPANIDLLIEEYGPANSFLERLAAVSPDAPDEGWTRLTRRLYKAKGKADDDAFQRPTTGLGTLDPARPIVVVLKKIPGELEAFVKTLKAAPRTERLRAALVIDEEADEASLHYKQKRALGGGWAPVTSDTERTAINRAIVEILHKLERSTYVGYTATPFANCFADAGDPDGFFPHAIQVLDPPAGYFGATQVFDSLYDGPPGAPLPSQVHTKSISNPAGLRALDDALDDYLIAAGVRLFRQAHAGKLGNTAAQRRLRHHTMMVHVNTRRTDQEGVRDEVQRRLFTASTRGIDVLGPEETATRLRARYASEFLPISQELLSYPGRLPTPELDPTWIPEWEDLEPFIHAAVDRLNALSAASPGVVLLVNSDADSQTPNYDGNSTPEGLWCVLVGGLMLSRGFTIEGLSTAYFRRKAGAMDTQLQLARWNGYRNYFEDLIRLYFGTAEPGSRRSGPRNLLVEFETSSWRDYEFREQLRRYGEEGTSPRRDLPKLIDPTLGGLLPATSPGKSKGLVTASGAPMEFGRRGTGLGREDAAVRAFAGTVGPLGVYSAQPVCPKCDATFDGRKLQLLTKDSPAAGVQTIVEELLSQTPAGSPLGITPEDEKALRAALTSNPWLLGLIGTSGGTDRTVKFGGVDVPIRLRRYKSVYDTLSTGDWNDWMRVKAGGECRLCEKRSDDPEASTIILVPYVDSATAPAEDAKWGFLIQTAGRAGLTYRFAKPSAAFAAPVQP
jgi:hypothetical protein